MRFRRLSIAIAAAAVAALPVHAQGLSFAPQTNYVQNSEQDLLRGISGQGRVLPFGQLRAMVQKQIDGRLISSELDEGEARRGKYVYRFTFMRDGGQIFRVYVDAQNGRILGTEG